MLRCINLTIVSTILKDLLSRLTFTLASVSFLFETSGTWVYLTHYNAFSMLLNFTVFEKKRKHKMSTEIAHIRLDKWNLKPLSLSRFLSLVVNEFRSKKFQIYFPGHVWLWNRSVYIALSNFNWFIDWSIVVIQLIIYISWFTCSNLWRM